MLSGIWGFWGTSKAGSLSLWVFQENSAKKKCSRFARVFDPFWGGPKYLKNTPFLPLFQVLLGAFIIQSCSSGFFREKLKVRARSDFRTLLVDRNRKSLDSCRERSDVCFKTGCQYIIKGIPKGSEDFSGK